MDKIVVIFFILLFRGLMVFAQPQEISDIVEDVRGENIFEFIIHKNLKPIVFHLFGNQEYNYIERIDIYWKDELTPFQKIETPIGEPPYRGSKYFEAIDMNFDGYKDIRLLSWWGATGNTGYDIWTYNPEKNIFERSDDLSNLGNPIIDYAKEEIHTSSRGGHAGMIYRKGVLKFINGELVLVEEESQDYIVEQNHYLKIKRKLINGNMKVIDKEIVPNKF